MVPPPTQLSPVGRGGCRKEAKEPTAHARPIAVLSQMECCEALEWMSGSGKTYWVGGDAACSDKTQLRAHNSSVQLGYGSVAEHVHSRHEAQVPCPLQKVKTANYSTSPKCIAASYTQAGKETVGQPDIIYQGLKVNTQFPDPSTNHCDPYP